MHTHTCTICGYPVECDLHQDDCAELYFGEGIQCSNCLNRRDANERDKATL